MRAMAGLATPAGALALMGRTLAPRKALTVSEWADAERFLSAKGSAMPGKWSTARNPLLREPMDCFSVRSSVHDVCLMFPIQLGKSECAVNTLGYCMDFDPGPVMVCLPSEVSMNKWVTQKLHPAIEETPAMRRALTSVASRDAANTRNFKDFAGGQLYMEHAGSPSRLKSTSVRTLIVDELDEFANNLPGGDDPVEMLNGRTSAFPALYKRLYISTPQMKGTSRIEQLWEKSDKRRYHVPCPHCGHMQPLEWGGLHWEQDGSACWYVCRDCGAMIEEKHKADMLAAGVWKPEVPEARVRGYHCNGLYYPFGIGPRWLELVRMWLDAQGDPARLKTFINDRLAETWEDQATSAIKHNTIADRAEDYDLGTAPEGVLAVTAGVDTQDNRLAVQLVGWGVGMRFWVLHYTELQGDPASAEVWAKLTDLLTKPIMRDDGVQLQVGACAVDMGGHRTEAVKDWVRGRYVRRPLAIFGAKSNTAPVLGRGKMADVDWRGRYDRRGVLIHQVGTVAAKHWIYSRLSVDAGKPKKERLTHFSAQLGRFYFAGLVSEVYNPAKNRFEKRRSVRNEPLDTFVYAYAAAHHPELRLHRMTQADWAQLAARLQAAAGQPAKQAAAPAAPPAVRPAPATQAASRSRLARSEWLERL